MRCSDCGKENCVSQVFQENSGSVTKTKMKEVRHGVIWWLLVGWWWMIIKLILYIVAFIPMILIRATRKKKMKGVTTTVNLTSYKTVWTCPDCGNTWIVSNN